MLTLVDEYTRECLAIDVARRLKSDDVLERLPWLFATRGVPKHLRSDNGCGWRIRHDERRVTNAGGECDSVLLTLNNRMKRWEIRIVLCLLLGAVTTVGVAWGLALIDSGEGETYRIIESPFEEH